MNAQRIERAERLWRTFSEHHAILPTLIHKRGSYPRSPTHPTWKRIAAFVVDGSADSTYDTWRNVHVDGNVTDNLVSFSLGDYTECAQVATKASAGPFNKEDCLDATSKAAVYPLPTVPVELFRLSMLGIIRADILRGLSVAVFDTKFDNRDLPLTDEDFKKSADSVSVLNPPNELSNISIWLLLPTKGIRTQIGIQAAAQPIQPPKGRSVCIHTSNAIQRTWAADYEALDEMALDQCHLTAYHLSLLVHESEIETVVQISLSDYRGNLAQLVMEYLDDWDKLRVQYSTCRIWKYLTLDDNVGDKRKPAGLCTLPAPKKAKTSSSSSAGSS